jgi:hypothetical protein
MMILESTDVPPPQAGPAAPILILFIRAGIDAAVREKRERSVRPKPAGREGGGDVDVLLQRCKCSVAILGRMATPFGE